MNTVTKEELVRRIAKSSNMNEFVVAFIVQRILDCIKDSLIKGEDVELRNFGIFRQKIKGRTQFINPLTQEHFSKPPEKIAHFKAGAIMAKSVLDTKE